MSFLCGDFASSTDHSPPTFPPPHPRQDEISSRVPVPLFQARISAQWLSELRRLWMGVPGRNACQLVFLIGSLTMAGENSQPTPSSLGEGCVRVYLKPATCNSGRTNGGLLRASAVTCGWNGHRVRVSIVIIIIYPLTARVVGAPDDFATSLLHFSLFSTALWDLANSRPIHSLMLSSHLFLCLPCLLPPFTVPCKMGLSRPDERETCQYHCSLRLFTMVRSSCGPIACWILARTSSLVTWSLYEMRSILQ